MIHYHGTPFSGDTNAQLALARRHAMVSFAEPSPISLVSEVCQSFTLDNGAFSAWTRGAEYKPDEYLKWAELWLKHPGCDWAIAPDVIDGSESENDALLVPGYVPVWHLHESFDRLMRLAEEPRIALGSSGEYAVIGTKEWWARMIKVMNILCDKDGFPMTKIHGLRMLDTELTSTFPFSSADSTNVARNIGIDSRWRGPYSPSSRQVRALVMIERIESHATAHRWNKKNHPRNFELFG